MTGDLTAREIVLQLRAAIRHAYEAQAQALDAEPDPLRRIEVTTLANLYWRTLDGLTAEQRDAEVSALCAQAQQEASQ